MFKFVQTDDKDKYGNFIYKRKRVFRKFIKDKRYLTNEQKQEIDNAFFMFDWDRSGTIDVTELRDAMKALGIFLKKKEVGDYLQKVDKDGSGSIDRIEFTGLMAMILSKRDQVQEMRKVFRCYDNDDDGQISAKNIIECADVLDMRAGINEERVNTMIEVGDRYQRGYVDIEDFMYLMQKIGLLNQDFTVNGP